MNPSHHKFLCFCLISLSFIFIFGCSAPTYINDVDPSKTRRINPDRASKLPKRLTIAELYRIWGPGGAGKELIYLYRSTGESEWIYVLTAPSSSAVDESDLGETTEVIKILFFKEGNRPIIIWESEVKNEQIDRMLEREFKRYEQNHRAQPATTDNDYDCPSRGGAALWASHSHV